VNLLVKGVLKSRRGISPILATLLLVVIVAAAIVATYAWIMSYLSSAGQQASVILSKDVVSWPSNKTIVLYIRNTGTSDAVISTVYIGTSAANLTKVKHTPDNAPIKADGGTAKITIENYTWTPDTRYYFKVVPKTGAPLEFSEKSPGSQ
jgi:flagellin-like protein